MKLLIDSTAMAFLCAMAPEPVLDFETKRPRADDNGNPSASANSLRWVMRDAAPKPREPSPIETRAGREIQVLK